MLLIITSCPATCAHLSLAGIPHTAVPTTAAAEIYLANPDNGRGHLVAYGPDVAAQQATQPVVGVHGTLLVVPTESEPPPGDWSNAVRLGVDHVVLLPVGADWLSRTVADAARTVNA